MKMNPEHLALTLLAAALFLRPAPIVAQGMPPEARKNIHSLFDNHDKFKRTLTLTKDGYMAVTESDDPVLARTLRSHVAQMRERLDSGLGARMWDPAYAEMRQHYTDLSLKVEPTEKGLRVVMTGRTPAAAKVAQNHAQIVSKFIEKGWPEHDVKHPAVAGTAPEPGSAAAPSGSRDCGTGAKCCMGCRQPSGSGSPKP
jgi:hypothetical protein